MALGEIGWVEMDLGKVEWSDADWIHQAQSRDPFRALVNIGVP
jgi:hypothetical protein